MMRRIVPLAAGLLVTGLLASSALAADIKLLNVSYDPTRELYGDFNAAFADVLEGEDRRDVDDQAVARRLGQAGARGDRRPRGRRRHARARLRHRRDRRASGKLLPADWQTRLPNNSAPYTSTIVFLVRKGNPEGHQGLGRPGQAGRRGDHAEPEDLGRRALELPRGLGLRAATERRRRRDKAQGLRRASSTSNVPVLDTGARGSTTTFVAARHRRRADRLGERGVPRRSRSSAPTSSRSSCPSISILAEPPVAVVDKVVDKHGTREVAEAYLEYLYTPEGQEIAAKHYYRPRDRGGRRRSTRAQFPKIELFTIDEVFGGWHEGAEDALRRRRRVRPDLQRRATEPWLQLPRAAADVRAAAACCPGFGLTLGLTLTYLSLIVLIPLAGAVRCRRRR